MVNCSPGPGPCCGGLSPEGAFLSWVGRVVGGGGSAGHTPVCDCDAHSKEKICWSRFLRGELNKMLVFSGLWSSLGRAVWAPSCPWEGPVVEERWGRAWHVPSHLRHTSWLVPRRRSCHTVWPRRSGSPSLSWLCLKPSSRDDFLWAACPSHACLPSSVCWRGAAWGAVPVGGVCGGGVAPGAVSTGCRKAPSPALRSHHQLQSTAIQEITLQSPKGRRPVLKRGASVRYHPVAS